MVATTALAMDLDTTTMDLLPTMEAVDMDTDTVRCRCIIESSTPTKQFVSQNLYDSQLQTTEDTHPITAATLTDTDHRITTTDLPLPSTTTLL